MNPFPRLADLFKKRPFVVSAVVLAALGLLVYANSLSGQFVWDDYFLIVDNPSIKSLGGLPKLFAGDIAAGVGRSCCFYRPLQMLTYALDHSLWGLRVEGYHFTNILLHILTAFLLFVCAYRLSKDTLAALLASAFFLVHPIHTEAVAYISGRADILAALFMLLTFILYLRTNEEYRRQDISLALLCYLLALLSKEHSIVLLVILLLYHWIFQKRFYLRRFMPFVALSVVYFPIRALILKCHPWPTLSLSLFERIPGFFVAVKSYLVLLIWPSPLHMGYGLKVFPWLDWRVLLGLLIILCAAYSLRYRKGHPLIVFSIMWFFAGLLPVSNIFYPLKVYMAEHWLYMPSMGFFLILGKALSSMCQRRSGSRLPGGACSILAVIILSLYAGLTIRQNHYWRDPVKFYERTLAFVPENKSALINLGIEYNNRGNPKKAAGVFIKALNITLYRALRLNSIAVATSRQGNARGAVLLLKKAIGILTANQRIYDDLLRMNHSVLTAKVREMQEREAELSFNLAAAVMESGDLAEAVDLFERAVKINPDMGEAYIQLGGLYGARGDIDGAISSYRQLIRLDPTNAFVYYNLSVLYFYKKDFPLARAYAVRAAALGYPVPVDFLRQLASQRSP